MKNTTFNLKNQIDIDVASESYIATGNTTSITPYPSVGNGQSDGSLEKIGGG